MTYDEYDPIIQVQDFLEKKRFYADKGDNEAYRELKTGLEDYLKRRNFDAFIRRLLNKGWVIGDAADYKTIEDACELYVSLVVKVMEKEIKRVKAGKPIESGVVNER